MTTLHSIACHAARQQSAAAYANKWPFLTHAVVARNQHAEWRPRRITAEGAVVASAGPPQSQHRRWGTHCSGRPCSQLLHECSLVLLDSSRCGHKYIAVASCRLYNVQNLMPISTQEGTDPAGS
jgi:hypothetical protein